VDDPLMRETNFIHPEIRDMILAGLPLHCARICEQILIAMDELMFSLAIVVTESEVQTLMIPVPTHETEAAIATGLRRHLQQHRAVAYGVCTEGWLRFADTPGLSDPRLPSEHPDGVEAVMIMGDAPGGPFHCAFRTVRDETGKVRALGDDLVAGRAPPKAGLFMGLLGPPPKLH
jgi:hypothetical protein